MIEVVAQDNDVIVCGTVAYTTFEPFAHALRGKCASIEGRSIRNHLKFAAFYANSQPSHRPALCA
ncbi:MAG: hypothetical protein JWM11_6722 [Planctomycetaceae bacterium]|nr:hypothetical protein [Planctomycetaceae bacterium]